MGITISQETAEKELLDINRESGPVCIGVNKITIKKKLPKKYSKKRTGLKGLHFDHGFYLIHSPFLLPSFFLGGKRKEQKNNQSRGQNSSISD